MLEMKNDNGITLIALVIIIIILLILAAVTIGALSGDNGILEQAARAKEDTEEAAKTENAYIEELEEIIETQGNEYIKNDDLPENQYLKEFITEWTVNAGDTITLPIYEKEEADEERGELETYFNYDFTVDYGDGTVLEVKSYNDENRKHTYTNSGTYTVKIKGICESWSFYHVPDSAEKVSKLVQWGVINAKHYDFGNCVNLNGNIPLPSRNSFNEVLSFRMLFYKCANITGKIPNDLFKYATKVVTMANVFNYATGLSGGIYEDLFVNCKEVTNFRFVFAGSSLSGNIPEDIFKENTKVNNFQGVFFECVNLTGYLPKNIFSYSNVIENLSVTISSTNLKVSEIYINSKIITNMENNGFLSNLGNETLKFYVPKDSETEKTVRGLYGDKNNVIIEVF